MLVEGVTIAPTPRAKVPPLGLKEPINKDCVGLNKNL